MDLMIGPCLDLHPSQSILIEVQLKVHYASTFYKGKLIFLYKIFYFYLHFYKAQEKERNSNINSPKEESLLGSLFFFHSPAMDLVKGPKYRTWFSFIACLVVI